MLPKSGRLPKEDAFFWTCDDLILSVTVTFVARPYPRHYPIIYQGRCHNALVGGKMQHGLFDARERRVPDSY